jgi:hypothetical protein
MICIFGYSIFRLEIKGSVVFADSIISRVGCSSVMKIPIAAALVVTTSRKSRISLNPTLPLLTWTNIFLTLYYCFISTIELTSLFCNILATSYIPYRIILGIKCFILNILSIYIISLVHQPLCHISYRLIVLAFLLGFYNNVYRLKQHLTIRLTSYQSYPKQKAFL